MGNVEKSFHPRSAWDDRIPQESESREKKGGKAVKKNMEKGKSKNREGLIYPKKKQNERKGEEKKFSIPRGKRKICGKVPTFIKIAYAVETSFHNCGFLFPKKSARNGSPLISFP